MAPDQLDLDGFEKSFNDRIVETVSLAAHGDLEMMLAQDLLIVVRTILSSAGRVRNASSICQFYSEVTFQ